MARSRLLGALACLLVAPAAALRPVGRPAVRSRRDALAAAAVAAFGATGAAVADTSALGSTLIPAMEKNGYTRRFAAAITAASSVIGPIIPPSGIMIIYAYVMGESVAALFLAGIVPGILVGLGLMVVVRLMADVYDLPKAQRIVTPNQTISPVEHWVSFILLRLNLAALLLALPLPRDVRLEVSVDLGQPCLLLCSLSELLLILRHRLRELEDGAGQRAI